MWQAIKEFFGWGYKAPEVKPEVKPEEKPEVKPEVKAEVIPEPVQPPAVAPEPKPVKSVTAKRVTKPATSTGNVPKGPRGRKKK